MKKKYNFFILVPRFDHSGPVKGAIALANGLILTGEKSVFIVSLFKSKLNRIDTLHINKNVKIIYLHFFTLKLFFTFLKNSKITRKNISISFCFLPDLLNIFIKKYAFSVSSLRGNLFMNYKFDYGLLGILLAFIHFRILKMLNLVLVMTHSMRKQASSHSLTNLLLVSNFINEIYPKPTKSILRKSKPVNCVKYLYVGSFSTRKNILELVKCFVQFKEIHDNVSLDMYGSGPLKYALQRLIDQLNAKTYIVIHDHCDHIEKIYNDFDILVLPSLSEGTPRVALEALFNGVSCILRDVDGNSEFSNNKNIFLFKKNNELVKYLTKTYFNVIKSKNKNKKNNLLSDYYSQKHNSKVIASKIKKYSINVFH